MSISHDTEMGPVDIVVIGFPPGAPMTGEGARILADLVDRGIVRLLDVMFVIKKEDGTFAGFDATDLSSDTVGEYTVFEGASSGLLADDDLATAADAIEPGSSAVLIVYENRWAGPFAAAVRRAGGEMLASERIPVADLIAAADAADAAS
jgi:Family of unknown function (DUF6325)